MPATEQLTITLPSALAQSIRAKVAAGEYASESEFVCESVVMNEAHHASELDADWGPSDDWILRHALPALDELESDPSTGISHEELLARLAEQRAHLDGKSS
jgi:Arc/MetJ-type ribon-helix-helix transcriptional regulator